VSLFEDLKLVTQGEDFELQGVCEKGTTPMTGAHRLGFTPQYLEACTDLKLMELRDSLLREPPEESHDDLRAVLKELEKRQKKSQI
jgi:hypothetical protein